MTRFTLTILLLVFFLDHRAQQDPQYNMYQFNQLVINPAYAGARDALQVIGAHRQQWLGFPGAPVTTCLSIHSPVLRQKLGVVLTLVTDVIVTARPERRTASSMASRMGRPRVSSSRNRVVIRSSA